MSEKNLAFFFFQKLLVAPFKDALCSWQAVLLLFVNGVDLGWTIYLQYLSDYEKILRHTLISYSSLES